MSDWTTKEEVTLFTLVIAQRRSAGEIAIMMGRTRDSVLGKMYRMNLKSRSQHPKARNGNQCAVKKAPALSTQTNRGAVARTNGASPEAIERLLGLHDEQCKWPIGEVSSPDFRFCGAHAEGQYCKRHMTQAYADPKPRPRVKERERVSAKVGVF